ncbi:hypothetical protein [uncultured Oscillibacter sp.]|uniref:hypothetical protein n=1 Tax=uncultured Oscillibacter sp. TaxID=876091 RepID=UPI0026121DA9|nr:hypothetical protein [uncultured Oscillibacter sp.]
MSWLKSHWKPLAVVLALALGSAWYARPVDVYGLSPEVKDIGHISLYVRVLGTGGQDFPIMELTRSDPEWDTVKEAAEALRFRRPPWNLLLQFLDQKVVTGRRTEDGDFHVMLTLADQNHGYVQIQFFVDKWTCSSPHSTRSLALWVKDARETGSALAETLLPLMKES